MCGREFIRTGEATTEVDNLESWHSEGLGSVENAAGVAESRHVSLRVTTATADMERDAFHGDVERLGNLEKLWCICWLAAKLFAELTDGILVIGRQTNQD